MTENTTTEAPATRDQLLSELPERFLGNHARAVASRNHDAATVWKSAAAWVRDALAAPVAPAPAPDSLLGTYGTLMADLGKLRERDNDEGPEYEDLGTPSDEEFENIRIRMEELIDQFAEHLARQQNPYACADCGTTTARTYVVTTLDYDDPTTRTEVCKGCDDALAGPADPADTPWTVIGFHDGDQYPVVTGVVAGHVNVVGGDEDYGLWADPVRAASADEAADVALADRDEE